MSHDEKLNLSAAITLLYIAVPVLLWNVNPRLSIAWLLWRIASSLRVKYFKD